MLANKPSQLQAEYPLSPRKFWKKMLAQVIPLGFLSIMLGGPIGLGAAYLILGGQTTSSIAVFIGATVGGFLLLCSISLALYAWYIQAYIRTYYYEADEHFITIRKGVFAPTEIHVQYQKIQDVYVDQDIIDRALGLYDVHIASATASSGIEAHIDGVDARAAEAMKELLLKSIRGEATSTERHVQEKAEPKLSTSEEISIRTFPFSPKWVVARCLTMAVSSFVWIIFIGFYLVGKSSSTLVEIDFTRVVVYAVLLWLVVYGIRILYFFLWKKYFSFQFFPDYVYTKQGVIAKSEKHVPYKTIQDVTVSQGIIDRLFGVANVVIENAAQGQAVGKNGRPLFTGVVLSGQTPERAAKLTEILKSVVMNTKSSSSGL